MRAVSIPKKNGSGERILGVPTVGDRIAQMVVKQLIEADLDSIFLPDSYGYRPRKSALDAVGVTRQRCWKYDWVLAGCGKTPERSRIPEAFACWGVLRGSPEGQM